MPGGVDCLDRPAIEICPEYKEREIDFETFKAVTERLGDLEELVMSQNKELIHQMREATLRESRLTALLDIIPMGMMITLNRIVQYVNRRVEDLLGYKKSELVGRSTRVFYSSDDEWEEVGKVQVGNQDSRVKVVLRKKDGSPVNCFMRMTRVHYNDNEYIITVYVESDYPGS